MKPEIVEAVVIRPGDKLLVRVPTDTSAADCQALKAALDQWLPDMQVYIVTGEQIVVQRGSEAAAAPTAVRGDE